MQLATAAVVNAVWDLWARAEGKPLWKLVVEMTPEELVRCIDFRYITDALTPQEAVEMLRRLEAGKADRIAEMEARGYPAYTTSVGWAIPTTRFVGCAARRWPRAGPPSS